MPSTPKSYIELREKLVFFKYKSLILCIVYRCEPVYCCYQLFDQPVYQTEKKLQASHIYWNDLNLYFLGTKKRYIVENFELFFFFKI